MISQFAESKPFAARYTTITVDESKIFVSAARRKHLKQRTISGAEPAIQCRPPHSDTHKKASCLGKCFCLCSRQPLESSPVGGSWAPAPATMAGPRQTGILHRIPKVTLDLAAPLARVRKVSGAPTSPHLRQSRPPRQPTRLSDTTIAVAATPVRGPITDRGRASGD